MPNLMVNAEHLSTAGDWLLDSELGLDSLICQNAFDSFARPDTGQKTWDCLILEFRAALINRKSYRNIPWEHSREIQFPGPIPREYSRGIWSLSDQSEVLPSGSSLAVTLV